MNAVFHYVLAILEGGLSGACFYRAGQAAEKKNKVLLYTASALWFVLSLIDGTIGGRELKKAKTLETNGGNDNA